MEPGWKQNFSLSQKFVLNRGSTKGCPDIFSRFFRHCESINFQRMNCSFESQLSVGLYSYRSVHNKNIFGVIPDISTISAIFLWYSYVRPLWKACVLKYTYRHFCYKLMSKKTCSPIAIYACRRFSVLCSSNLLLNALQELGQTQVSYLGKTLISQSFVFIYPGSFPWRNLRPPKQNCCLRANVYRNYRVCSLRCVFIIIGLQHKKSLIFAYIEGSASLRSTAR